MAKVVNVRTTTSGGMEFLYHGEDGRPRRAVFTTPPQSVPHTFAGMSVARDMAFNAPHGSVRVIPGQHADSIAETTYFNAQDEVASHWLRRKLGV